MSSAKSNTVTFIERAAYNAVLQVLKNNFLTLQPRMNATHWVPSYGIPLRSGSHRAHDFIQAKLVKLCLDVVVHQSAARYKGNATRPASTRLALATTQVQRSRLPLEFNMPHGIQSFKDGSCLVLHLVRGRKVWVLQV